MGRRTRTARRAATSWSLLGLAGALALAPPARSQTSRAVVTGVVTSSADGAPVGDALVRFLAQGRSARTDAAGRFHLADVTPGPAVLQVRSFGFARVSQPLALAAGDSLDLDIVLDPAAYTLDEVVVEGRAFRQGFYDRWRMGIGRFIPREEIEAKAPLEFTDLLRGIAGIRLVYGSRGVRVATQTRGGCAPQIRLDGMRVTALGDFALDDLIAPEWIEGVEIYRSEAEAPAEFGRSPCGLILVWTRGAGR